MSAAQETVQFAGQRVQDVRRTMLAQGLHVATYGIPRHTGRVLVVANHASRVDRRVLSAAWPSPLLGADGLRWGGSALAFPEGGISPDGSVGRFRAEAFDQLMRLWRRGVQVQLIPVAISGTFGIDRQLPWWRARSEQPRIEVRAGAPIGPSDEPTVALAEQTRDQIVALLAEGESTWWQQRRGGVVATQDGPATWHSAWQHSSRRRSPGEPAPRKIWR